MLTNKALLRWFVALVFSLAATQTQVSLVSPVRAECVNGSPSSGGVCPMRLVSAVWTPIAVGSPVRAECVNGSPSSGGVCPMRLGM